MTIVFTTLKQMWIFVPLCDNNMKHILTLDKYTMQQWDTIPVAIKKELHVFTAKISIMFGYMEEPQYEKAMEHQRNAK